jgi:hypothetical protein
MTAYEWAMAAATGTIAVIAVFALAQISVMKRARWQSLWEFLSQEGSKLADALEVEMKIDEMQERSQRIKLRRKWHYHLDAREEVLRIQPKRCWPWCWPWHWFEITKDYERLLSWYWKGLKLYCGPRNNLIFNEIRIYHDPERGDPDPQETGYRILTSLASAVPKSVEELTISCNIPRTDRKNAIENRLKELRRIHMSGGNCQKWEST